MIDIAPEYPARQGTRRRNRGGPDPSDDVRLPQARDGGCKRAGVSSCFECPFPDCVVSDVNYVPRRKQEGK